jgi:hypothetical protein
MSYVKIFLHTPWWHTQGQKGTAPLILNLGNIQTNGQPHTLFALTLAYQPSVATEQDTG